MKRATWIAAACAALVMACGGGDGMCMGERGSVDCQCRADGSCDDGLTCGAGLCVPAARTQLALPPGARGCEVLLNGAGAVDVEFSAQVRGTFVQELPNVAVTVIAGADEDFQDGAVLLVSSGAFTVVSSSCVGSDGQVMDGVGVTL